MTLRPYQYAAVQFLRRRRRGIVVAAAGSGKTVIGAAALAEVVLSKPRPERVKVGWMCSTLEQAEQGKEAMRSFPDMLPHVHVKVRCAAAATDWSDRDVLVCDEVHHSPAPGWRQQVESCKGARWGLTATPEAEGDDAAERNKVLRDLFGEVHVVPREAVASNLAKAMVVMLDATDPGLREPIDAEIERVKKQWSRNFYNPVTEGELASRAAWFVCVKLGIVGNKARNDAAVAVATAAVNEGKSVLVLVNQVEHAQALASRIPSALACYAKLKKTARSFALGSFQDGDLKCIVATSLADEGLDLPRASVLVLVSGGKNKGKTEQRTGRVLRAFAGKQEAVIYDFLDRQHPLMERHSQKRVETYLRLGYEVANA